MSDFSVVIDNMALHVRNLLVHMARENLSPEEEEIRRQAMVRLEHILPQISSLLSSVTTPTPSNFMDREE